MELRQLEYLVAVAEEQSFTRAAERVHISQSGISAQIRELERDLGLVLIDRSSRRARVTSAGAAVLEHARAALGSAQAVRRVADELRGVVRGRLAVGMVSGCTVTPLFDALAAFHRAHPGVELSLVEEASDRLLEGVRLGELDAALVASAGPPVGLESLIVVSEGLVAGVPATHPLADRGHAALPEVTAHPLVCLPPGTGIRACLDEACATAGTRPRVVLEASAPTAVVDLAARGLGVAILSESLVEGAGRRLRGVRLDGVDVAAVLAFVWRPTTTPALGELVRHARAAFGPASAGT